MAGRKLSELTTTESLSNDDLVYAVDVSAAAGSKSKGITKANLAAQMSTSVASSQPVENEYADITALLADQGNQTEAFLQYVVDASDDPNIASGEAYYEKLSGSTTTLADDYRLLSDTETEVIRDSNSYRVFRIAAIQDDGTPLTSVAGGRISFEYSGTDVTAILFNKRYTDAIAEFYETNVNIKFYNRTTRKYQTESVASAAWTTVNTDYYRAAVTGTNIQIADLTVNDRVEFFIVETSSGSSTVTAKTGTSVVFTDNAEYYADGSFNPNTSGNITLSATGAVVGVGVAIFVEGYVPTISGETYITLSDTSNGVRDIYFFYNTNDGIKLNIIGESVLTTPVITLTPADEEIQVDWTTSVGATSYTVLRNTTNTTVGATSIYTGALLTYTDTGLTNGTDYYYFVQATGGTGKHDSAYGTNTDQPEAYPATAFAFNVKTDNTGTSTNVQFTVPTYSASTYNCTVDWGDGNSDVITTYNDAAWTHTYSSAGTYRIVITGVAFEGFRFTSGDPQKLISIEQWGLYKFCNASRSFYQCTNLTITATDAPDLTSVTTLQEAFSGCTALTSITNIDTWSSSGVTTWTSFFRDSGIDQDISGLDISGATTLASFLYGTSFNNLLPTASTPNNTSLDSFLFNNTSFNDDISVLDYSNGPKLQNMLSGCTAFNHVSIESIDVSACDDFDFMLRSTTSLDRSLASWDTTAATSATGFMDSTSISQSNYDATLIGWDTRTGYTAMNWDFNTCNYTAAGAGGTARSSLVVKGLTFTDVAN